MIFSYKKLSLCFTLIVCLSTSQAQAKRRRSGQSLKAKQFERVFKAWDTFLLVVKSAIESIPEQDQAAFIAHIEKLPHMTEEELQSLQIQLNNE